MAQRHPFRSNSRASRPSPSGLARQVSRDRADSNLSEGASEHSSRRGQWLETTPTPATAGSSLPAVPTAPNIPTTSFANSSSSSSSSSTAVAESDAASRLSQCSTLVEPSAAAQEQVDPGVTVNLALTYHMSSSLAASIMRPLPPLPGEALEPPMPTRTPPPPRPERTSEMATQEGRQQEVRPGTETRLRGRGRGNGEERSEGRWEGTRQRFERLMQTVRGEARQRRTEQRQAELRELERRAVERRFKELGLAEEEVRRLEERERRRRREREELQGQQRRGG